MGERAMTLPEKLREVATFLDNGRHGGVLRWRTIACFESAAEIERLLDALDRYSQHDDGCEIEPWHGKGPVRCSCGLAAVAVTSGKLGK